METAEALKIVRERLSRTAAEALQAWLLRNQVSISEDNFLRAVELTIENSIKNNLGSLML